MVGALAEAMAIALCNRLSHEREREEREGGREEERGPCGEWWLVVKLEVCICG